MPGDKIDNRNLLNKILIVIIIFLVVVIVMGTIFGL